MDWAEIEALQAELAAACNENIANRLSERNCVELIMKLKELNMIELIHTTNGKQYLTPERVKIEVYNALVGLGGRAVIPEIADELYLDYDTVENSFTAILEEKNLVKHFAAYLTPVYLDNLAEEIQINMNQSGFISIGQISQDYDFTGKFLLEHIQPRLKAETTPQKSGFYTESYLRRLEAGVRGYLSAAKMPLKMKALYQRNQQMDENWMQTITTKLLESGRIKGRFLGRGETATFIPQIYLEQQKKEVKQKIDSTGNIQIEYLKRALDAKNDHGAKAWMKENYPDYMLLATQYVSASFIRTVLEDIESRLSKDHIVDLYTILPDNFTQHDLENMLRHLTSQSENISEAKTLGSDWLIDGAFIEQSIQIFQSTINERADKAAVKKIVTIITEDDVIKKDQKGKEKNKEIEFDAKEKGGGGGRGAREAKTKGKDKKRKKNEAAEAEKSNQTAQNQGALSEVEIADILKEQEPFDGFEEETLQEMVDILFPILSEHYQSQAKSIFTHKQQVKNDSKQVRKSRKEQEEIINNCYAKLKLCQKGLGTVQSSSSYVQFEKHLMKTLGNDLINFIFALSSDSQETNLSLNMRLKILKQTESEPEALDNLTKLNNAKVPLDVLENAQDAAEYGAGMMIKFDKNREKSSLLEYIESMNNSLESCTDLPTALHITMTSLFSTINKSILHFPGKLTPSVIELLRSKLLAEQSTLLSEAQDAVLKEDVNKEEILSKLKDCLTMKPEK